MKFKEIKPGMVIHCPKEEDARAVSEHLIKLGVDYADKFAELYGMDNGVGKTDTIWIRQKEGYLFAEYSDRKWYEKDEYQMKITEFSDLIEPENSTQNSTGGEKSTEMSAVEVLEWLSEHCGGYDIIDVFGRDKYDGAYELTELIKVFSPQEIIDKITAYEAAKKAPKPVEAEWETQYTIKSRYSDLQNWEDRVIVTGYENAREMRENSERILKEHINSIVGEPKYPVSDYYVIPLRRCRIKESK